MKDVRLPCRPQYVKVRLDADMAPDGPLENGAWPHAERVLTYHYFGKRRLRRGDRVAVNGGLYQDCFGTVIGRDWRRKGYTFGVRRTRRRSITVDVTVKRTAEFEVA